MKTDHTPTPAQAAWRLKFAALASAGGHARAAKLSPLKKRKIAARGGRAKARIAIEVSHNLK